MGDRLRVCVIASSKFPVREPFAGGLEAHTHSLVRELRRRGHEVTLFAAPGSDPALGARLLHRAEFTPSEAARLDVGAPPEEWLREHHAYLDLMLRLAEEADAFDVVHNNSLHHLPVAMARMVGPMVTTLHTPPLGVLESAVGMSPSGSTFVAVSAATAAAWAPRVSSTVVRNGVDTRAWCPRPGPPGTYAVWFGRVVPEKAPHHAALAARRAGVPLVLAGPAWDPAYFETKLRPLLGAGVEYLGHLDHRALREVVAGAAVAVATPSWDEPYGLVAAEAMACGTPVAAYARGAMPELVDDEVGALAVPDDPDDLARAMRAARGRDRGVVRRRAETEHSLSRMVAEYEDVYRGAMLGAVAA